MVRSLHQEMQIGRIQQPAEVAAWSKGPNPGQIQSRFQSQIPSGSQVTLGAPAPPVYTVPALGAQQMAGPSGIVTQIGAQPILGPGIPTQTGAQPFLGPGIQTVLPPVPVPVVPVLVVQGGIQMQTGGGFRPEIPAGQ